MHLADRKSNRCLAKMGPINELNGCFQEDGLGYGGSKRMGIAVVGFCSGFPGCIGAVSSLLETLVFRVLLCPAIGKVAAPSLYHLLLSERGEFFPYHTNATCSNLYLNLRQLLSKPLSEPHVGNAGKKKISHSAKLRNLIPDEVLQPHF